MGKTGRRYSPEFKQKALQLVQASDEDHPVPKIARDLGLCTETLRKWVNQAEGLMPESAKDSPPKNARS